MRVLRLFVGAVCLLLLSGCFDLLQEVWLRPDGSGRVVWEVAIREKSVPFGETMTRGLLESLERDAEEIGAELKKDPDVVSFAFVTTRESGVARIRYTLEVKDATRLPELQQRALALASDSTDGIDGRRLAFRVERLENRNLLYVQPLGSAELDAGKRMAAGLADAFLLGENTVTVRVHGGSIVETNGTLDARRETAEWRLSLRDVLVPPPELTELRAEVQANAPWYVWMVVVGVPVVLLLVLVGVAKRRRPA